MSNPRNNKIIYSNSGPPSWEFIDEKWKRKIESKQKYYYIDLAERIADKQKDIKKKNRLHRELIRRVGPDWYQELSPEQLELCDNLINCLIKDIKDNTIINTQKNIGQLGIIPRPNHKLIEMALKESNQCPVEFLLILYQLIQPTRRKYSLNDRLLLSAVVHLSMEDTLRELHIRIPSPPPQPRIPTSKPRLPTSTQSQRLPIIMKSSQIIKKNRSKSIKTKSPYLVPFNFVPKPPKFTGIYKNKHLQLPESPYFNYRNTKESNLPSCNFKFDTLKLEQARIQEEYLPQLKDVASSTLTGSPTCLSKEKVESLTPSISECYRNSENSVCHQKNDSICYQEKSSACYQNESPDDCCTKSQEFCDNKSVKSKSNEEISCRHIESDCCAYEGKTENRIENFTKQKTQEECDCLEKFQQKLTDYKNYVNRVKALLNLKQLPNKYIIGGVVETKSGPVYINQGVLIEKNCPCVILKQRKNYEKNRQIMIKTFENQKEKFNITGVVERKEGTFYIISSIVNSSTYPCKCHLKFMTVQQHYQRLKIEYEEKRQELVKKFSKEKTKFVLGGVIERPDGPVFMISTVSKPKCNCTYKSYDHNNQELQPKKIQIDGTTEPVDFDRTVLTTGVTEEDKCSCNADNRFYKQVCKIPKPKHGGTPDYHCKEFYQKFQEKHKYCLLLYEKYLQQIEDGFNLREESKICFETDRKDGATSNQVANLYMKSESDCFNEDIKNVSACSIQSFKQTTHDGFENSICFYINDMDKRGRCDDVNSNGGYTGAVNVDNNCFSDLQNNGDNKFEDYDVSNKGSCDVDKTDCCSVQSNKSNNFNNYACYDLNNNSDCYVADCCSVINNGNHALKENGGVNKKSDNDTIQNKRDCFSSSNNNKTIDGCFNSTTTANSLISKCCQPLSRKNSTKTNSSLDNNIIKNKGDSNNRKAINGSCNSITTTNPSIDKCCQPMNEKNSTSTNSSPDIEITKNKRYSSSSNIEAIESCFNSTTISLISECYQPMNEKNSTSSNDSIISAKQIPNRIFNLNKIPTKFSAQSKLLKQVLETMAFDGFPLAKLPNSYKLPHFKLWMALRCKKSWTQDDRRTLLKMSSYFWKHTDICYQKVKTRVKLPICKEKAKELTWSQANYSKKIVSEFIENYYKRVRQENVNSAREFYPTMYSYEFPTKGFRNCYFAYLSSKEEDCIVKKIWQPHEYKKGTKQN